jgi:hypothetical protein
VKRKTTAKRSFYLLEMSVPPGAFRQAELHTYSDLDLIRRVLESWADSCSDGGDIVFASGATLGIWVVQLGKVTAYIDLRDHVFVKDGSNSRVSISSEAVLEAVANASDWVELARFELSLEWEAIRPLVPPLQAPLLEPGRTVRLRRPKKLGPPDSYLPGVTRIGSIDEETGENPAPFPVPLSPAEARAAERERKHAEKDLAAAFARIDAMGRDEI